MRKFIFALLIFLVLGFSLCFKQTLTFFCKNDAKEIGEEGKVQYSGASLGFLCENVSKNCIFYEKDGEIMGECVFIAKNSLSKIANRMGLVVLKRYFVGKREIIEGTSPLLKYNISGVQANVQICIVDDLVQIASPIIYGSF